MVSFAEFCKYCEKDTTHTVVRETRGLIIFDCDNCKVRIMRSK